MNSSQPQLTAKCCLRNFAGDRATTCVEDIMQQIEREGTNLVRDREVQSGEILGTNYNLSVLAMKC